jgi:hypothetical protein
MFAGSTVWLNWSASAADIYEEGPEAACGRHSAYCRSANVTERR